MPYVLTILGLIGWLGVVRCLAANVSHLRDSGLSAELRAVSQSLGPLIWVDCYRVFDSRFI
jgi:hypothetical protein